ncbi:MAG: DUF2087 domain-containing protein [Chloroflexota bacterium]
MEDISSFLKVMADSTRLNIVGLLAQKPRSGDELAALLDVKPSTISHHATRLQAAGLLATSTKQYYKIYALNTDALTTYVDMLTPEQLAQRVRINETLNARAYTDQILATWIKDNRITDMPRQAKHRRVVMDWLVDRFEKDQRYDEDQVWMVVNWYCHFKDVSVLVPALVSSGLMDRVKDGSWYWRRDSATVQVDDFVYQSLPIAQSPDHNEYNLRRAKMRELEPDGEYANLKPPAHAPNLDRQRKLIAFRMQKKGFTREEMDAHILKYRKDIQDETETILADMIREGSVRQDEAGVYWRHEVVWEKPPLPEPEDDK